MPRFPKAAFLQTAFLAALFLVAVPTPNAAQAWQGDTPVEPGQTFTGRVVEVTDGDTFGVRRSIGGTVTIRLHGVDGEPS
ncbi:endonuclease YncB(thermonuclease family) [Salinibacter ruber]|uniref:Endonuclease YncB(Thermonuclease family) n=1 Tax=Salinibacter ruber TaxID=146919 RepID=A0A9X2U4U4_9BACT|nr:hypothetical protein [Salinibacter ruber]MCS3860125.1 endonuclease YncB(thermonuclease family) [Salinibacter ruber]MCS3866946.1 endonuclease YncB(thermonuclease family) [Salinibacter ruber]